VCSSGRVEKQVTECEREIKGTWKSEIKISATQLTMSQGIMKIITDSMKAEGPGFWMKGWTPAWLRLA
jgi:hypothetical protein